jgi:2',3'-cyclic-nucleotide 2'-phosphodiesterase (5'-nucleotidase family)
VTTGGLARLAGAIKEARTEYGADLLVVDTGGVFPERGPRARQRGDLALKAMEQMDYDAIGLASKDIAFGFPGIEKVRRTNPEFPVVISNLVRRSDSSPPFGRRYIIREKNGIRIGILSVAFAEELERMRARSAFGNGLQVTPPVKALESLVQEVKGKTDIVVLLSQLPQEQTFSLVREVAGIHVALLGSPLNAFPKPIPPDLAARFVWVAPKGNILRRIELSLDADRSIESFATKSIRLDKTVREDLEIGRLVADEIEGWQGEERRKFQEQQKRILQMTPEQYLEYLQKQGRLIPLEPGASREKSASGCSD